MKYQQTQIQKKLLKQKIDISRLTILQRKSLTRLQFFSFHHKNFIRSINDQFKNLRIIILSLMIKFYSQFSQKNLIRLNIIKQIVYQSNLENLTQNKGLEKQQLHKCVCIQLQKLSVGFQVQSHIINIFNCAAFFDQIILRSIQQKFIHMGQLISIQVVQKWIQKNMQIKIKWNTQQVQNQKQDELYLWKDQQNIYRESTANMVFIEESSTQSNNQNEKSRQKQVIEGQSGEKKTGSKVKLFQTISVASSISPYQSERSPQVGSASKYRNHEVEPFYNGDSFLFQCQQKKHFIRAPPSKSKQSSFWNILCCSCEKDKD